MEAEAAGQNHPHSAVPARGSTALFDREKKSQLTTDIDVLTFEIERLVVVVGIVRFCVNHVLNAGDRGDGSRKNDTKRVHVA
jgi:hypothetical protein